MRRIFELACWGVLGCGATGLLAQAPPPAVAGLWQNPSGNLIEIKAADGGALQGRLVRVAPDLTDCYHEGDLVIDQITAVGAGYTFHILFKDAVLKTPQYWATLSNVAVAADGRTMGGDYPAFDFQPAIAGDGSQTSTAQLADDGHLEHYEYTRVSSLRVFDLGQRIRDRKKEFDDLEAKLLAQIKEQTANYAKASDDYAHKLDDVMKNVQRYAGFAKTLGPELEKFWTACAAVESANTTATILKWGVKAATLVAAPEGSLIEHLLGESVGGNVERLEKLHKATEIGRTAATAIKSQVAQAIGSTVEDQLVRPLAAANEPPKTATNYDVWMQLLSQQSSPLNTPPEPASNVDQVAAWLATTKGNFKPVTKLAGDQKIEQAQEDFKKNNATTLAGMNDTMIDLSKSLQALADAASTDAGLLGAEVPSKTLQTKRDTLLRDEIEIAQEFETDAADATPDEKQELQDLHADWQQWDADQKQALDYEGKAVGRLFAKAQALKGILLAKSRVGGEAAAAARAAVDNNTNGYMAHAMPGTMAFFASLSGYLLSAQDEFQAALQAE